MSPVDVVWTVPQVRELVAGIEPACSVYLGIQPSDLAIDFAADLGKRWRAHTSSLTDAGTDTDTRDAVSEYLRWLEPEPTELAVFASQGRIRTAGTLPDTERFDLVNWGAPASVVPLLAWLQRHPPYVVGLVDRSGADVTTVPAGATRGTTETVRGPDDEIDRVKAGGWSSPRYQRRAEDSWQHNAEAAAGAIAAAADRVGARLLLIGGDVRMTQLLAERLPALLLRQAPIRHVSGGRSPDGSQQVRHEMISSALAEYAAATNRESLERFAAAVAGDGIAVAGAADTLAALLAGRVETLFVPDGQSDSRTAWFGPDLLCVSRRDEAPAGTESGLRQGPLVDVAVRAALLTDAQVRVIDTTDADRLPDRIGALCRFR